jgi:predicted TIM-barrel fold metal-dependent hydrolase
MITKEAKMMRIVDCQSHVFPGEYIEFLARNPGFPRAILDGEGFVIQWGDVQRFKLKRETYSTRRKLVDMDRSGIGFALLSTNMPGPCSLPVDLGVPAARALNDSLIGTMEEHPERFGVLAGLPWNNPRAAVQEIERVHGLGACGVVLYSHIGGEPVDDASFEPVYDRAEELKMPIVLHPTVPTWAEAVKDHSMITMMALQVDTSFALLRLILGGVLDRHPGLRVVMPHAGGVLPYMMGRIEHQTEVLGRGREHITRSVASYLEQVYFDIVSPSSQALRFVYDFSGADRLVFGTDHPWVDPRVFLDLVSAMDITREEKSRILGGNARDLFHLVT